MTKERILLHETELVLTKINYKKCSVCVFSSVICTTFTVLFHFISLWSYHGDIKCFKCIFLLIVVIKSLFGFLPYFSENLSYINISPEKNPKTYLRIICMIVTSCVLVFRFCIKILHLPDSFLLLKLLH